MANNPDNVQDILSKNQSYLDSVARAEEELKHIVPLAKKIKADLEGMKDKKFLRFYKLQIYDAKKNSMSLGQEYKEEDITIEDEEKEEN